MRVLFVRGLQHSLRGHAQFTAGCSQHDWLLATQPCAQDAHNDTSILNQWAKYPNGRGYNEPSHQQGNVEGEVSQGENPSREGEGGPEDHQGNGEGNGCTQHMCGSACINRRQLPGGNTVMTPNYYHHADSLHALSPTMLYLML
jgi:hypothetical protein